MNSCHAGGFRIRSSRFQIRTSGFWIPSSRFLIQFLVDSRFLYITGSLSAEAFVVGICEKAEKRLCGGESITGGFWIHSGRF